MACHSFISAMYDIISQPDPRLKIARQLLERWVEDTHPPAEPIALRALWGQMEAYQATVCGFGSQARREVFEVFLTLCGIDGRDFWQQYNVFVSIAGRSEVRQEFRTTETGELEEIYINSTLPDGY